MLLRLAYHDAASYSIKDDKGGSNASIQFEFERPENMGLKRGWNVVQQVRRRQVTQSCVHVILYLCQFVLVAEFVSICAGLQTLREPHMTGAFQPQYHQDVKETVCVHLFAAACTATLAVALPRRAARARDCAE